MAIETKRIPDAIAGVVSAIADGVDRALEVVDAVKFPPKVVFDIDSISELNSLRREVETTIGASSRVISESERVDDEIVFRDGLLNQVNQTTVSAKQTSETTSSIRSSRVFYEDQAIKAVFEYPGPGYEEASQMRLRERAENSILQRKPL